VVLSPRWGILLLEVKDWRAATLGPATRDAVELRTPRGQVTAPHPLRQARDHALELVDLMQNDPAMVHEHGPFAGRLLFPYGWGVVLASMRRTDVAGSDFDELFPPARTLLRDDLDEALPATALQHRLWGMFTVSYPHTLTLPQRDRVRWYLLVPVSRSAAALRGHDARHARTGAVGTRPLGRGRARARGAGRGGAAVQRAGFGAGLDPGAPRGRCGRPSARGPSARCPVLPAGRSPEGSPGRASCRGPGPGRRGGRPSPRAGASPAGRISCARCSRSSQA